MASDEPKLKKWIGRETSQTAHEAANSCRAGSTTMSRYLDNGPHPAAASPFLKWPGGKRWLAPSISKIIGEMNGTYYEPFLGGAAVYFYLRPRAAVLSDRNKRLIQVYRQVQRNVEGIIGKMKGMRPSKKRYSEIREYRPRAHLDRAVQFLYLNRTAFNGMYRVNQRGYFNVPYGCKTGTRVCEPDLLWSAACALRGAELIPSDFEEVMDRAGSGDVVYCDPPFTVKHDNNGFIRYNECLFSWGDQERLAKSCSRAADRGALVMVSNAHHTQVRDLYTGFEHRVVKRKSLISGSLSGRGEVSEYLFVRDGRGRN